MFTLRTFALAALVSSPALLRAATGHASLDEVALRYGAAFVFCWLGITALAALISITSPPEEPDPDTGGATPDDGLRAAADSPTPGPQSTR